MLPVLHNNCSSQIPLPRMAQGTFLLLSLPLFLLLHVGQATTCQGDNCPTGDYYLESKTMAHNWTHCSNWINDNLPLFTITITGLVITGGKGDETSIETFPAEADCSIPPFPEPGNLLSSPDYQSFIHSPHKGERATPSLSLTTEGNWWLVAATWLLVAATRLLSGSLASLGGMGKRRAGKTTTHWGEIPIHL